MSFSEYLANKLNDHVLRGTVYTPPTDIWVALFTSNAGLESNTEGSWTEVTGGAYARLLVDDTTRSFVASAASVSANNEDWEFPKATAPWGIITHAAVMDAATSGNVMVYAPLGTARDIIIDDILRFLAGELTSTNL